MDVTVGVELTVDDVVESEDCATTSPESCNPASKPRTTLSMLNMMLASLLKNKKNDRQKISKPTRSPAAGFPQTLYNPHPGPAFADPADTSNPALP